MYSGKGLIEIPVDHTFRNYGFCNIGLEIFHILLVYLLEFIKHILEYCEFFLITHN